MSASSQLFAGITAWNSELLLPLCLDSLRRTAPQAEIVVLDNESTDDTQAIARSFGAKIVVKRCGQADALNSLAALSNRRYTVLIHADVVFISPDWVKTVVAHITGNIALVSPEDIGCGPYTRPWGKGMPESSFMCFATRYLEKIIVRRWFRRFRVPYYRKSFDFYGDHITYNLPGRLAAAGLAWVPMAVHVSQHLDEPYFVPDFPLQHWSPEMGHLRYGLGNFYSLDGVMTHYHNWYDRRADKTKNFEPEETLEVNGGGVPIAYLKAYTENFMSDYRQGKLNIPKLPSNHQQARKSL
jgi:glycosyltransferase involved in cell wall biosynthesis